MQTSKLLRVGTRGSILAKTQTQRLIDHVSKIRPDIQIETIVIKTTGDQKVEESLPRTLGKGLFTREIEDALLAKEIDLAVHSLKDLPTILPDGLTIGAIPGRESPFDAVIGNISVLENNPEKATVGTSSLRRAAQLRILYKGCQVVEFRGNLDTRLRKIEEGIADCAIVAVAGLNRLGQSNEIKKIFNHNEMLPAPAQGALGIEIRNNDPETSKLIQPIHSARTELCVSAERIFQHQLGGGCQVPVAALATISEGLLTLDGRVIALDGSRVVEGSISGHQEDAAKIGSKLAKDLLQKGAGDILSDIREYLADTEEELNRR
ncbi:hydroxymethylbilane synthase [Verrucomicrobiota bacterium]